MLLQLGLQGSPEGTAGLTNQRLICEPVTTRKRRLQKRFYATPCHPSPPHSASENFAMLLQGLNEFNRENEISATLIRE